MAWRNGQERGEKWVGICGGMGVRGGGMAGVEVEKEWVGTRNGKGI